MNVRLNLATKPLESHRRFLTGAGLLAVLGGILFLALGWHVYSTLRAQEVLRRKEQENDRRAALLQARRRELDEFFARPENAKLKERANFVNSIIDERSFDWTQMFMDLEKIMPVGVHVVSIQPQLEKGHMFVRLTVAATTDESKIKFLHAMESSSAFSSVELVSVHAAQQGSGDLATLELNAIYVRS
jgi:type IV pilus assembly protein PilN